MTKYGFTSQKMLYKEEVAVLDPKDAFKHYVEPRLLDETWLEDSKKLTDTNMSSREWVGLVVYALSLERLIGKKLKVGKDSRNGDGAIVLPLENGNFDGLFLEQTLLTYKQHSNLLDGLKERIQAKSNKGESYVGKQHLAVWCNIDGEIDINEISKIVNDNLFSDVVIMGYNKALDSFICYIFKKGSGIIGQYSYKHDELLPSGD